MQQATADLGTVPAARLTQGTEHGPPSVDELDLTVAGECLGVSRETSCVPAIVTGELAVQVVRGAGEGAQELSPLCRAMVKTCVSQMWFKIWLEASTGCCQAAEAAMLRSCSCTSQIESELGPEPTPSPRPSDLSQSLSPGSCCPIVLL